MFNCVVDSSCGFCFDFILFRFAFVEVLVECAEKILDGTKIFGLFVSSAILLYKNCFYLNETMQYIIPMIFVG